MGAAEHERVDAGVDERLEVFVGDVDELAAAGHALLDEVDEARARARRQLDVRGRGERVVVGHRLGGRAGADHPDPAVARAATARRVAGRMTSTTGTS